MSLLRIGAARMLPTNLAAAGIRHACQILLRKRPSQRGLFSIGAPGFEPGTSSPPGVLRTRAGTSRHEETARLSRIGRAYASDGEPVRGRCADIRADTAGRMPAGGGRTLRPVPAEVLDGRLSEAVARALEQHRAELAELVEQQVEAELERLAPELVDEALARRNGASAAHGVRDAARTSLDIGEPAATAELKRCSTCRRELPRSEYGPDRRSPDGLRARCRECRQRREYPREVAARRARRAREKPRRAAQGPASDDDAARPDPRDPPKTGERLTTARTVSARRATTSGCSPPVSRCSTSTAGSSRPTPGSTPARRSATRACSRDRTRPPASFSRERNAGHCLLLLLRLTTYEHREAAL